jgi:hypothetical protein
VISKADSKKASARGGNYQDAVTAPVSRNHDDSGTVEDEEDGDAADDDSIKVGPKATAVGKVLSPQLPMKGPVSCACHSSGSLYVSSGLVLSDGRHGSGKSPFTNNQRVGTQRNH